MLNAWTGVGKADLGTDAFLGPCGFGGGRKGERWKIDAQNLPPLREERRWTRERVPSTLSDAIVDGVRMRKRKVCSLVWPCAGMRIMTCKSCVFRSFSVMTRQSSRREQADG